MDLLTGKQVIYFCEVKGGTHNFDFQGWISEGAIQYYLTDGAKITKLQKKMNCVPEKEKSV